MKILFITILVLAAQAQADQLDQSLEAFVSETAPYSELKEHQFDINSSNALRTGVTKIGAAVEKMLPQARAEKETLQQAQDHCQNGQQQKNEVQLMFSHRPLPKEKPIPQCERGFKFFHKEVADQKEAEQFTKKTLDGKTPEGKELAKFCPDPCSYYVYNSVETKQDEKIAAVDLLVQCSQPKSGLLGTYDTQYHLIHRWACE